MGHFLIVKKYLFASCCIVLCMVSAHFCMCSACHIKGDCLHLLLFPCFCLLFTIIKKLLHTQGVATFIAQISSQNILERMSPRCEISYFVNSFSTKSFNLISDNFVSHNAFFSASPHSVVFNIIAFCLTLLFNMFWTICFIHRRKLPFSITTK